MKDYDHIVVWLDYFNRNLTRSNGRRLPRERCVAKPSIQEISDAARTAGLKITESNERARFPRRPHIRSGYLILPKSAPKASILHSIGKRLGQIRARQKRRK